EKLLVIDSFNHKPSLNFKRMQLSLSQYSGSVIQIMFKSTWGGGRYFQDIDSVQVIDGAFMHHENTGNYLTQNSLKIAMSPDNRKIWIIQDDISCVTYQIYDMSGRLILKGQALRGEAIDLSTVHRGVYFLVIGQNVRKIFIADE
ncbi:MAG: T9SS type A sorting domain-containing protein, partial [Candidatus Calescibacterium sp.]|nr:T9SS type A sorting domain-containing protein [Candidatus Calescibacterium sp.]